MSYIGNTEVGKMFLGNDEIAKGYLGDELVFDNSGGSSGQSYDSEIEYLESSGTQYIDTGIVASTDFACEIKAEFTANGNSWDTLLGSYSGITAYGVALALRYGNDANKCYIQFGGDGNASRAISSINTLGLHTYKTSASNSIVKIDVDGSVNTNPYDNAQPSPLSMYLFARHRADTSIGNYAKAKVYYCKIWIGGVLVRDFIPVRVGQVGYMYDRVSSILFRNLGTGLFTLGNDIQ